MSNTREIPVLGFAAYSGTGKTTLLTSVLPLLSQRGIRVGMIKHAHHTFEIDHEGKDSYELRKAGARQVMIGSSKRWALMVETEADEENSLSDLINHLDKRTLDLILVEGFKPERIPKIEIVRPTLGKEPFYPHDSSIVAVATDAELPVKTGLPILDLNRAEEIAGFIIEHFIEEPRRRLTGN